ncbi:hypothetical protein FDUTEX481_06997 [Tolypothrix sp. PCC 7601]|nr:hypothetical protein FDUTEX481_06997 [Tolypothrix sp. PCC 7601]
MIKSLDICCVVKEAGGREQGAGEYEGKSNYPLPITHSPLLITHYPLPITQCPMPIASRKCQN